MQFQDPAGNVVPFDPTSQEHLEQMAQRIPENPAAQDDIPDVPEAAPDRLFLAGTAVVIAAIAAVIAGILVVTRPVDTVRSDDEILELARKVDTDTDTVRTDESIIKLARTVDTDTDTVRSDDEILELARKVDTFRTDEEILELVKSTVPEPAPMPPEPTVAVTPPATGTPALVTGNVKRRGQTEQFTSHQTAYVDTRKERLVTPNGARVECRPVKAGTNGGACLVSEYPEPPIAGAVKQMVLTSNGGREIWVMK